MDYYVLENELPRFYALKINSFIIPSGAMQSNRKTVKRTRKNKILFTVIKLWILLFESFSIYWPINKDFCFLYLFEFEFECELRKFN